MREVPWLIVCIWSWISAIVHSIVQLKQYIRVYWSFLHFNYPITHTHTHSRTQSHMLAHRHRLGKPKRSISFTVIYEQNTLRKHVNGAFCLFLFLFRILFSVSLKQIGNGNKRRKIAARTKNYNNKEHTHTREKCQKFKKRNEKRRRKNPQEFRARFVSDS